MGPAAEIARRMYARLPVPGQNLALSVFGLKYRWERLGGRFGLYVTEFAERDRWSPEEMHDHVENRLRALLLQAFRHSPYYGKQWQARGVVEGDLLTFTLEDLGNLPIVSKEALRSDPLAFLSTTARSGGRLSRHQTSGSTGTPVTVFVSREIQRRSLAVREARSFNWAGVSTRRPRATIGARLIVPGDSAVPPFYRHNLAEHQVYLSSFHIAPQNVASYVEGFNRYRPQVLCGMAHSYYLLGQFMLEQDLKLAYQPRAAILGSEKVTSQVRRTVEEAFRTRVFEEYGSVEDCALATECEAGRLHVSPDFGIVEIVDEQGRPAAPGLPGRLVCTGLVNEAQPLVRYEIGDMAIWSGESCPCGRRHLPVLEGIVGRTNDVIQLADGRRIAGCDEVFSGVPGVVEGQVVQHSVREFTLRVVAAPGFGASEEDQLRKALKVRLGDVDVEIARVATIARTSSGKFKPVVSAVSAWAPSDEIVEGSRLDR
jgi:phenylacetate-coenzyme A ligase PaaK-like adenylate-forming protein